MSSSIITNSKRKTSFDVYLSFCSVDGGHFGVELYKALCRSVPEAFIFMDFKKLTSTDWLKASSSEASLKVIEECKMVVIILSRYYTISPPCLQELEKITECCLTTPDLVVLPVLYPIDQRFRRDIFGEAFHDFLDRIRIKEKPLEQDKIMTWVEAISNSTQYPTDFIPTNRSKSDCVKSVVERVICRLYKIRPDFSSTFYTPSVKSSVQDVLQLLKQTNSPLLIGIWGIAGIGKTSIAKTIYDMIGPYFEGKYMLDNVSEVWGKNKGQEELFHVEKDKLQNKRVLLILEDVNKLEQLNALCGSRERFGAGSKIIITTWDRHLLEEYGVDHIYRVKELDESESLEVFKWCAFGNETTLSIEFAELSRQVVAYSGGWPLALITLGRLLRGKEALQWKGVLWSLKNLSIPAPRLLNILEKSFNELSDNEKQTFLDIASFFVGKNQNDALSILNRSTQSVALQISLLQNKSLVTIDENNKLQMHVLLQAMARDVINRESRSRTNQPKMYDVFLSFRGEDSRAKFMSHLYSSLQSAGIYAFRDDNEIQQGDQISTSLLRAIEQSKISLVVLSTNYANSRWCMLELERIMEIGRAGSLVVVPVFYEVDPTEVRHQEGQFGKAFEELMSSISMDESIKSNWRRDLIDICSNAGFVLKESRDESDDVKNIVEKVSGLLNRTELFVAKHPVGVESRVKAVIEILNTQKSKDVFILGIWGMGGMGKTTIAKAIYNQIGGEFDGKSFLLNVREIWETKTNRVSLQQHVLCDVYKTMTSKINDIESGKNVLKEKLPQKKILFVLDDVNEIDQLEALCGSHKWFGRGSRIIITTRDKHILNSCRADQIHEIKGMYESESLELFSWHAFKQSSPTKDFATLSTDVIAYSGGLPLALQVLGSYLSDCEITVWQKVLEKLKCIPHNEVQNKLKVSFDGLKDDTEKQAFLDIACFFIGMDRNDATQILNGCGFFADVGIKVLIERSLVTVDNSNKLQMHDLLRDMGRQIVNEESPFDLEKRSRLWRHEEVFDVLSKYTGTEAVKGLALEFPIKNKVCLDTEAFKKMNKLRLLQLVRVQIDGDFKDLSGELRWLYWHGFPSTYIPEELQKGSLVAMELEYSNLKLTWNWSEKLENLKILNLSHSRDLKEIPDFGYMPNLEKIVLKDCPSLSNISHTIGYLQKVLLINLTDCTGLEELPSSIYKSKSLETLILSGCSMIDKLEDLEEMKSLTTLIANNTAISKVSFSIVRSKNIKYISLPGFEGFSRDVFASLIRSWMSPSKNVISLVQTSASMSSLGLCMKCDSKPQLSQDVAIILDALKATNCQKLEASASSTPSHISDIYPSHLISDYIGQASTSKSNNFLKSSLIQMGTKLQATNIAEDNILQTADGTWDSSLLPCDNIFNSEGRSITFDLPEMKGRNLKSMMFVVYYSSPSNMTSEGCQVVLIINYTKTTIQAYTKDALTSFVDEDWKHITSNLESGNKVEIMVVLSEGLIVEKTKVSLLYDEPVNKEMELCNVIGEEGVILSSHDDKNIGVSGGNNIGASGGNNIDVPMDDIVTGSEQDEALSDDKHERAMERCHVIDKKDVIIFGDDVKEVSVSSDMISGETENLREDKHWHAVDEIASVGDYAMLANANYVVSGGSDTLIDENVIVSCEDENVSDDKNWNAVDKDVNVSGEADNNVVSVGDKNGSQGLLSMLPSIVRAVLISRPSQTDTFSKEAIHTEDTSPKAKKSKKMKDTRLPPRPSKKRKDPEGHPIVVLDNTEDSTPATPSKSKKKKKKSKTSDSGSQPTAKQEKIFVKILPPVPKQPKVQPLGNTILERIESNNFDLKDAKEKETGSTKSSIPGDSGIPMYTPRSIGAYPSGGSLNALGSSATQQAEILPTLNEGIEENFQTNPEGNKEDEGPNGDSPSDSSPKRTKFASDELEDEDLLTDEIETYFHSEYENVVDQRKHTTEEDAQEETHSKDVPPHLSKSQSPAPTQLSKEEKETLKKTNPLAYVKAMMAQKLSVSEKSPSGVSTSSSSKTNKQSYEEILQKIRKEVFEVDLFEVLKRDATASYKLKKLINQINITACSADVGGILIDIQTLIEQVTADYLRDAEMVTKLKAKREAQDAEFAKALTTSQETEQLEADYLVSQNDYDTYTKSINFWKQQIEELKKKISDAEVKQSAFKVMDRTRIEALTTQSVNHVEAATAMNEEISSLENLKSFIHYKLSLAKIKYDNMKARLPF